MIRVVKQSQELRRGAAGSGALKLWLAPASADKQGNDEFALTVKMENSTSQSKTIRVADLDLGFDSSVFTFVNDSVNCNGPLPIKLMGEVSTAGNKISILCIKSVGSESTTIAAGQTVDVASFRLQVKSNAPLGNSEVSFARTNLPDVSTEADLADAGTKAVYTIESVTSPINTPVPPTPTPTQVPPSPTPTSVPDECTVTSMNAGDGEFENKIEITFIYTGCPGGHQVYLSRIPGGWSQDVPTAPSLTVPHHTTNIGLNCGKSYNYCAQAMDADDNLYGDQKCDDGNTLACLADPTATPTPTSGVGGPSCSIDVFKPGDNLYNDRIFINLSYSDCPGGEYLIEVNRLDSGWSKTILTHDWGNYTLSNSGLSCGEQYTYSAKAYFSEIVLGSPVFVANDITGSTAACLSPTPTITPVLPTATPTIAGPTNTPTLPPFECTCENQDAKLNYKAKGDGDCNGATDLLDYNAWFSAFIRGDQGYAAWADFNCKNGVTIDDYGIWRENAGF